ncbi:chemotaxis protein CheA [Phaeobacter sp. B1627]|uniref:chemotaxis protein CheA n=1 Tax=Phaeobacter sp. B1627 TaxID=2583809 RepID=UPI0021066789|nr:chemotaxis protein CheA [Phaeobacter sp. B1627]
MKAIAEYFRDLAADDRYFGAEPPQPDADMLARIAQREIARQVEARSSDGGIHLRAAAADAPDMASAHAADAPTSAPVLTAPALGSAGSSHPEEVSPVTISNPAAPSPVEAPPSAAPAEPEPGPAIPADQTAERNAKDQRAERDPADEQPRPTKSDSILWGVHTNLTPTTAPATAAPAADLGAPDMQHADSVAAAAERPAAESIAAKLQRIRAVVAKTPVEDEDFTEDEHADSFSGDEKSTLDEVLALDSPTEGGSPDPEEIAHDNEDSISAMLDRLSLQTEAEPVAPKTADRNDTARHSGPDQRASGTASGAEAAQQDVDGDVEADSQTDPATVGATVGATVETESAPDADAVPSPGNEHRATQTRPAALADTTDSVEAPAITKPVTPRRPVKGRIIRVKRAPVDSPVIDSTAKDVSDPTAAAMPVSETGPGTAPEPPAVAATDPPRPRRPRPRPAPPPSSLSADDEAELLAELAAVEAELVASSAASQSDDVDDADDDTASDMQSDIDAAETDGAFQADDMPLKSGQIASTEAVTRPAVPQSDQSARARLISADSSPDGDLSRLMATANDRLSDEQAATSRATYNQLRAAVAAAQADQDGGDDARREARARAFREDLASVVQPHRSPRPEATTRSSPDGTDQGSRLAPLKLVAEQRIDAATAEEVSVSPPAQTEVVNAPSASPVRPRRVSSTILKGDEAEVPQQRSQDGAFARYASENGAVELQELLEAAASYMSFVEGRESFSRPQLINKVRMLEGQDDFNREDSLRSFGQLLREGKLKKASNGRFSVSSQIGFRPGNRAAG